MDYGLWDVDLFGEKFTYSNKPKRLEETRARLDRAVVNTEWKQEWPTVCNSVGFRTHKMRNQSSLRRKSNIEEYQAHKWNFVPMWLRDQSFADEVRDGWMYAKYNKSSLREKLRSCGEKL